LRFSERWRLAGIIATEVRFKGFLEANPSNLARVKEDPARISKGMKSSGRMNTFVSSFMVLLLAALSIGVTFDPSIGSPETRFAIGYSLFLLFSFVIVFFFNLTTTSGFYVSRVMDFPSTLPLERDELGLLALFAFARVFIAPAIAILTLFPVASAILYGLGAAAVALLGGATTVALSMGSLIAFSRWFYVKTHSSGESRLSTLVRLATTLAITIGIMSIYMLVNILPEVVRLIVNASAALGPGFLALLSAVFPFSFGFLAASVAFGSSLSIGTTIVASAASVAYALLGLMAYRMAGSSLKSIGLGGSTKGRTGPAHEVTIDIVSPTRAVIRKDMKLATKNIGSAMIFAIPVFLALFMYPMISFWEGGVRSMTVLVALEYASVFAGISVLSVMMFDTQGASIHAGLPLSTKQVLRAKVTIALAIYLVSLALLGIIIATQTLITPLLILIPLAQIPAGYSIPMAVGGLVYRTRGQGHVVAVNISAEPGVALSAAILGSIVGIVPLLAYGLTMIVTGSHVACLVAQMGAALLEAGIIARLVPRMLKD
jgi:hypothetical protein